MENGSLKSSTVSRWISINEATNWPEKGNTMVISDEGPSGPQMVEGYMEEVCSFMGSKGIGQQYWWCN